MLTGKTGQTDSETHVLSQLLEARQVVKDQLDEMSAAVENSTSLSTDATTQLAALHREYKRITEEGEKEKSATSSKYQSRIDSTANDAMGAGAIIGGIGMAAFVLATGGAGAPLAALFFGANAAVAGAVVGGEAIGGSDVKSLESEKASALSSIESKLSSKTGAQNALITSAKTSHEGILAQLKTDEQKKLYFGVIKELLLDNGINIARQLNQYAEFNGIDVDAVFNIEDSELRNIFDRMFKGQPKATDLDRLIAISDKLQGQNVVTPEIRTLKQFINHVLIPNKTYFDILASFADDMRGQDLTTFPALEILGQKPITFSGRVEHKPETLSPEEKAKKDAEFLDRAKAKVQIREVIAGNAVYEVMKDDHLPHLKKMEDLVAANEQEIQQYAGVFSKIEEAMAKLSAHQALLTDQKHGKSLEIAEGVKSNAQIDARIYETNARNQAKQKAATIAGRVRGGLALAGGTVLALMDGGAVSGGLIAHGAHALKKASKDSIHSVTYAIGQEVSTSVENNALDDYMFSLQLQKADLPALRTELAAVQTAIEETQKSKEFQVILKDEGKRSQVAETLLLRSIIRNGYNNSLEIEEVCQHANVESVDAFLDHYKGTRLGLALKKHCHGIADSNDLSVILAEANGLRGKLSDFDRVLKDYVEDTMKPNIAAYYSKASKMDVVAQNNLTGFGNELHFSAEMQMETNRAVRVLLSNEFGMSVVGREDVRGMFDFWLHRHGDRRLYDEKIRDGEMSDEYPDKRVSYLPRESMDRFVDMAKRSVASGRTTFPKVGDMFMRVCAYEYFLPQAIQVGGKDNIFNDYPQSPSAYPMVNSVVGDFVRQLSFSDIDEYRTKIGDRLDNVVAQTFIDFFAQLGAMHEKDTGLIGIRNRLKDAANYDDYAPVFDRYTKNITRDAMGRFDLFLDIYKQNLEKQFECSTEEDKAILEAQIDRVKDLADGKLNPTITRPGTHESRLRAHDESHTGENMLRRG
jgi:hypothetical protein